MSLVLLCLSQITRPFLITQLIGTICDTMCKLFKFNKRVPDYITIYGDY